ncbi:MAG: histidine kinase [Bacteroidota bacterium]
MPLKKSILHITICFTSLISLAQKSLIDNAAEKYRAINWGVNEGLAHDKTYCMLKDVNGFLWIGTVDGLSRFDGSTFKNFIYDPRKPTTIAGSEIRGLVEDSLHNIWVGSDKGLSRYDIKADTFSIFLAANRTLSFSADITPFWATNESIYCQEKDSFITRYNIRSFKKEILVKLTADDMLSDRGQYTPQHSIFDSSSNSIWLLCKKFHGGLLRISLSTQQREAFEMPGSAEAMCYDRGRNSIWINTDAGLVEFTLSDKQFHRIEALKGLEKTKDYGRFVDVDLDRQGRVWFASHPKGIIIYDPAHQSYQPAVTYDSLLQNKISEPNGCVYCDRDNISWLGFWLRKGVYQLLPFTNVANRYNKEIAVSKGQPTNDIMNFVKGDHGKMWMGTGSGLIAYNPSVDNFTKYQMKDLPGIDENHIVPIYADTIRGKLWFRTDDHGYRFFEMDIYSKACVPVVFKDSSGQIINPEFNNEIPVHYRDGCIITGEYNKQQCVFIISGDSAFARQVLCFPLATFSYDLSNPTPVTDHLLFLKRPDGTINLTYANRGDHWTKITSPMDSIPWRIIVYNKTDSSYWVTAQRELIHYDAAFHFLKKYNNEDGLPRDEIYGMIPDNIGNIWLNTYRSIYRLDAKTGDISILNEKDGFTASDFRDMGEGIGKDDNGDLYFSTAGFFDGFEKIRPAKFASPSSSVYIKSLTIKEFTPPSSTGLNDIQQLELKYFQNKIIIETGSIDYYSFGKNRIRYKLEREGKNENWQYAPANYTIRYEELPPGKYTLTMQASNVNNEFNGPLKTIAFQINPAFWNTWWFRIMAVIFIGLIFYGLIRWRLKQKFRLQLERSEKETQLADMRQKTAELKQQSTELEMQALRAQMNPHFIFNSLNSINRFILQNNRLQASEYLTKFSKLVRMILQNSQSPLIPLESELESLGLYLEMEALRFNYHFDYKISVPKDIDVEMLKVPPLILQPYVENAIWHGLMHKEEKGQLNIDVSQEEDHLFFKVTDNGIGRKKAAEIAGKSATKHKSMGLRITANRIAMMQSSNGPESPVKINDLVGADGTAAGTEVVIKMPVIETE